MAKYIQGRDGRFAGSIGDGATQTPRGNLPPGYVPNPYTDYLYEPNHTLTNVGLTALIRPTGKKQQFLYGPYECDAIYNKKTGDLTVVLTGMQIHREYDMHDHKLLTPMNLFTTKVPSDQKLSRQEFQQLAIEQMRNQEGMTEPLNQLAKALKENNQLKAPRRKLFGLF